MASTISHSWDLSPAEAFALQKKLATPVIRETQLGAVTTVAGIDVGFREGMAHAAGAIACPRRRAGRIAWLVVNCL